MSHSDTDHYLVSFHSYKKIEQLQINTLEILKLCFNEINSTITLVEKDNDTTNTNMHRLDFLERSKTAYLSPSDFLSVKFNRNSNIAKKQKKCLLKSNKIKSLSMEYSYKNDNINIETSTFNTRRMLNILAQSFPEKQSISQTLGASKYWEKKITGEGVKVAIFDSGIKDKHDHFRYIVERTNWTDDIDDHDSAGHGTFNAGIIASDYPECQGIAPDAQLHFYRVFSHKQMSKTSWFLDAFNHALFKKVQLVNFSIGGPDFKDTPFVNKILELSANSIIVVSAVGNDGPLYGTINNPADQMDVIGVTGYDAATNKIAGFSSRGMTTWNLPFGVGQIKPDIAAPSKNLYSSNIDGGCKRMSGTSVASPIITGALALLISSVDPKIRWRKINPASVKQILLGSATQLQYKSSNPSEKLEGEGNIYAQGAGKINLDGAFELLSKYVPTASAYPAKLNLTDCPYMWPYCSQPLFYSGMPTMLNVTVLNGVAVSGWIENVNFVPLNDAATNFLDLKFKWSDVVFPWTGYLGIQISIAIPTNSTQLANGLIVFSVLSGDIKNKVTIPLTVEIVPTPPKQKRVLFDQFHSIGYPIGYFPRDNLEITSDMLDWNGDSIFTNFRTLWNKLRSLNYFIEILTEDYSCINSNLYSTLLIIDPEDNFADTEITKLHDDMNNGLNLLVFGDWYSLDRINSIGFRDNNSNRWMDAVTGGSNIPGLNLLLSKYGILFGDSIYKGNLINYEGEQIYYASGSSIATFPKSGYLLHGHLVDYSRKSLADVPVGGLINTGSARIGVYGDSSCLDDSHSSSTCFHLLESFLEFTSIDGKVPDKLRPYLKQTDQFYISNSTNAPLFENHKLVIANNIKKFTPDIPNYTIIDTKHFENLQIYSNSKMSPICSRTSNHIYFNLWKIEGPEKTFIGSIEGVSESLEYQKNKLHDDNSHHENENKSKKAVRSNNKNPNYVVQNFTLPIFKIGQSVQNNENDVDVSSLPNRRLGKKWIAPASIVLSLREYYFLFFLAIVSLFLFVFIILIQMLLIVLWFVFKRRNRSNSMSIISPFSKPTPSPLSKTASSVLSKLTFR